MKKTLNLRLLVILSVAGLILGVAVSFLHGWQVRRHAGVLLDHARQAQEDKEYNKAGDLYRRFLRLAPEHTEASAEYGLLLADTGHNKAAFAELEKVLRHEPEHVEARRRLVDVAMRLGRYTDAREHLQGSGGLLDTTPGDAQLWEYLATCQLAADENSESAKSLETAISVGPDRLETYLRLAELLRDRLDRPEDADRQMDRLVESNRDVGRAYRLRGEYRLNLVAKGGTKGDDPEDEPLRLAAEDAAKALELAPEDLDVLKLATQCAVLEGRYEEARGHAERGVALGANQVHWYVTLAGLAVLGGEAEEAETWLRRGLQSNPDDQELLWALATQLLDRGDPEGAEAVLNRLRATNHPRPLVAYLEGRFDQLKGNWLGAVERLEAAGGELTRWPEVAKQAHYCLARCYHRLGNPDRRLSAAHRAVAADPLWGAGRLERAAAMVAAGQTEEALKEYRDITRSRTVSPDVWIQLAKLLARQNTLLPEADQNWTEFDEALERAEQGGADGPTMVALRADVLLARRRGAEAETLVLAARREAPDRAEYSLILARVALGQRQWEKAVAILDDAEDPLDDSVAVRLVRAACLAGQLGGKAAEPLRALAEETDGFSDEDRVALWMGLAETCAGIGDHRQAGSLCAEAARLAPHNLTVRLAMFEYARRDQDVARIQEILDQVEAIEGQGPHWHLGQAERCRLVAEQGGKQLLAAARRHLAEARRLRPSWSLVPRLAGQLDEIEGRPHEAVEQYQEAIRLGDRSPDLVLRAVELLHQSGQTEEANRLIRRLVQRDARSSLPLVREATKLSLLQGDYSGALAWAREVASGSDDQQDHVRLGLILEFAANDNESASGQADSAAMLEEAEAALHRATELAPQSGEAWLALVRFLVRNDRKDKAAETLAQTEKSISPDEAPLAMAQMHRALGSTDAAGAHYETAVAASPDDPSAVRSAVDFWVRTGETVRAERQLREFLAAESLRDQADAVWARRVLVSLLEARGSYRDLVEGIELCDQNLELSSEAPEDRLGKALLLAAHPMSARRQEARPLLESLMDDGPELPNRARFVLAWLHLDGGDWAEYARMMRELLDSEASEPTYVAAFVDALVQRGELPEADRWLRRLETTAPGEWGTVHLRARILFEQGQYDQCVAMLTRFIEDPDLQIEQAQARLRVVSRSLEQFARQVRDTDGDESAASFIEAAEALHRQYAESNPQNRLLLAAFLGRQGRSDEALPLLEQFAVADPDAAAAAVAEILRAAVPDPDQLARLEGALSSATIEHPSSLPLLLVLAEVRVQAGQYAEAEQLFREILSMNKDHVAAMNNLAILLALQGKRLDESLRLVERAIETGGPMSALLDSRAMIRLAQHEPEAALADLEEAIALAVRPTRYFHRAQAYRQLGKRTAAAEAMDQANEHGLTLQQLHPIERSTYQEFVAWLQ